MKTRKKMNGKKTKQKTQCGYEINQGEISVEILHRLLRKYHSKSLCVCGGGYSASKGSINFI